MSGSYGPERVRTVARPSRIERPTVADPAVQAADAEQNLAYGYDAKLTIRGYAATMHLRALDHAGPVTLVAMWIRDHVTDEMTSARSMFMRDGDATDVVEHAWSVLAERVGDM